MRIPAAFALGAAALALAAHAAPASGDAARGKALYLKNLCQSCHGSVGQGSAYGPKIAPHAFPWEGFERQVRHPRSVMPRYDARHVSDAELADIYAYVASVPEGKAAKDIPLLKE